MKRMVYLGVNEWKVLRALLRDKSVSGKELRRFWYARTTKNGKFLDDLAERGLIKRSELRDDVTPGPRPDQFRWFYVLTDLGRVAAEFGEYEIEAAAPQKAK